MYNYGVVVATGRLAVAPVRVGEVQPVGKNLASVAVKLV